ncbi:beta-ribofuranosylaminobenzene 5'-phosphate synthase [Variovorax sp. J22R133]|uniref:beta-ribofuranosylaminobenzene 5'-phosphate synthase family protein n=1 Tax=Variovorax brevis TaxID=3053503 RepID=UPI0025774942|nr:beta-ribofuranosylaminobenzene 5'-phosphate synthase family protein [Variovorax sp. J22R133]MDM0115951.1 beta-ribofuranosylaminobenzene 5'-phosphate synthase [Variovorax sp. J22R133]
MDRPRNIPDMNAADNQATVVLRAPGRLHLGFLDPAASLGRRFGSLGLVINGFETQVEIGAAAADRITATGLAERAEIDRAASYLRMLQAQSGRRQALHLRLARVLPAHAGFGSGTQLALAIARAFAQWHGLNVSTPMLAQWLGRGLRSGIGIAGFDAGGLLVDGGPGANGVPAPVLSRIALPEAWRVLIVQDSARHGISGADEKQRISALAPMPRELAADICHQVLMRVLPGAATADFGSFAQGVTRIQQVLGAHFAPAQGGSVFSSPAVARVLEWTLWQRTEYPAAIGQSSWGPTGFAIVDSQVHADGLVDALHAQGLVAPSLTLTVVTGRNSGATLFDRRLEMPLP